MGFDCNFLYLYALKFVFWKGEFFPPLVLNLYKAIFTWLLYVKEMLLMEICVTVVVSVAPLSTKGETLF